MTGSYDTVLSLLDVHFGEDQVNEFLPKARASLKSLRNDYRKSGGPTYADEIDRLAYVLAYHPAHLDMATWSLKQAQAHIASLASRESLNVVILGAGPGAELVALADHVAEHFPELATLDVTLVDRQEAWHELRQVVSLPVASKRLGACALRTREVKADLLSEQDRSILEYTLTRADFVISHAVLSEVASCGSAGVAAIDWLCSVLPEGAPMLLVDLEKSSGGKVALQRFENARLRSLTSAAKSIPIGKPPQRLEYSLFACEDDLWARQWAHAAMRLIARDTLPVVFPALTLTFTLDQQQAIESFGQFLHSIESNPVAVLRGAAGTGKSTLLRELVRLAFEAGRSPQLLAPTGQASKRLSEATDHPASTVHSALYQHNRTRLDEAGGRVVSFGRRDLLTSDLLIVDEASLIGDTSLDNGDEAVRLDFNEGQLLTDLLEVLELHRPGLQVLFVGDHYQLPPVTGGTNRPALDADALADRIGAAVPVWELEIIVRQAEHSPILATASHCRTGKALAEQIDVEEVASSALSDHAGSLQNGSAVIIAWTNNTVAGFNRKIRSWWGRNTPNPEVGDRLVAIRSTPGQPFINGDDMVVESVGETRNVSRRLGISEENATAHLLELVVSVDGVNGRVLLDVLVLLDGIEGQRRHALDKIERVLTIDARARWKQEQSNANNGISEADFLRCDPTFNALRVVYPYARTCHRAQGGEWDTVIVDLAHGNAAPAGWDYTAVTRARRQLLVVNRPRDFAPICMISELRPLLEWLNLHVEFRPLQHGAHQLKVQDDSATVMIDVYLKKGLPSKVDRKHGDDTLWRRVNPVIRQWGARVRAERQPITDPSTHEQISSLLDSVDTSDAQLTRRKVGDWEVEIEAVDDDGNNASMRLDHNSAGELTPQRPSGEGRAKAVIIKIQDRLTPQY